MHPNRRVDPPSHGRSGQDIDRAADADDDGDPNATGAYASPPCFMHEIEASYLGFLTPSELERLLVELASDCRQVRTELDRFAAALPHGDCRSVLAILAMEEERARLLLANRGLPEDDAPTLPERRDDRPRSPQQRLQRYVRRRERMARRATGALSSIQGETVRRDLAMFADILRQNASRAMRAIDRLNGTACPFA